MTDSSTQPSSSASRDAQEQFPIKSISHSFGKPLPGQKSLRERVGENTGRRMAEMVSSEAFKKLEARYNSEEISKREFLEGKRDLLKATK